MDGPSWQTGTSIQDTSKYINSQDNDPTEEKVSPPGEFLDADNPEENTANIDEDLSIWEEYIENVTVRVGNDNFNPTFYKPNAEKTVQSQTEEKLLNYMPRLVKYDGQNKYECTEPKCGKLYSSQWDAKTHIKTKHRGHDIECENCSKNFSKRSNMLAHMRNKQCPPKLDNWTSIL